MDYKTDQGETRNQLRQRRIRWMGGTLNLGIRKFKRTGASREYIDGYKENAWIAATQRAAEAMQPRKKRKARQAK